MRYRDLTSNFASEIHFALELNFGDSLRFRASVWRIASLRSFSSEILFASELSAEKLPFLASIVGVVVKIGAVLPTTLQHATTACPVSTHQLQSDSVCEV